MALLKDIIEHSNDLLMINQFKDYCPNGLQIEGKADVNKIVSGVTASHALIEAAINKDADIVLVHHGFFWRGEDAAIVGLKKQRIASLLNSNVSLLAYHLPLDAHSTVGNNVQFAQRLNLSVSGSFGPEKSPIGVLCQADSPLSPQQFSLRLTETLDRTPTILSAQRQSHYQNIAICTGAAQSYFEEAINAGADAFVTGEVSEQSYHLAMESGIDFYAAGHHATERFGVQALGNYLSKQFNIVHEYVEIPNELSTKTVN